MICFCESCHECFTDNNMKTDTLCIQCWAIEDLKKEGGENHKAKLKEQGDKGLPVTSGERERKRRPTPGQLSLGL